MMETLFALAITLFVLAFSMWAVTRSFEGIARSKRMLVDLLREREVLERVFAGDASARASSVKMERKLRLGDGAEIDVVIYKSSDAGKLFVFEFKK